MGSESISEKLTQTPLFPKHYVTHATWAGSHLIGRVAFGINEVKTDNQGHLPSWQHRLNIRVIICVFWAQSNARFTNSLQIDQGAVPKNTAPLVRF